MLPFFLGNFSYVPSTMSSSFFGGEGKVGEGLCKFGNVTRVWEWPLSLSLPHSIFGSNAERLDFPAFVLGKERERNG